MELINTKSYKKLRKKMNQEQQLIEQNTVDIRDLFTILKRRKKLILLITGLFILLAIIYISVAKPIYSGSVTLEVGQVADEQFSDGKYSSLAIRNLDNVKNLKSIINKKFGINTSIPKDTTLLNYTVVNSNKVIIKNKLTEAVNYTINRHKEKAKLYSGTTSKISMTQMVGDINIKDKAIKPKKKLIVIIAFITGLMLSIFLSFFLEFIRSIKKR